MSGDHPPPTARRYGVRHHGACGGRDAGCRPRPLDVASTARHDERPRHVSEGPPADGCRARQWMTEWLEGKAVGWEVYALAHGLVTTPAENGMGKSLLLEGTLVHQRCLIEFLVGRVDRKASASGRTSTTSRRRAGVLGTRTCHPGVAARTWGRPRRDRQVPGPHLAPSRCTRQADLGPGAGLVRHLRRPRGVPSAPARRCTVQGLTA